MTAFCEKHCKLRTPEELNSRRVYLEQRQARQPLGPGLYRELERIKLLMSHSEKRTHVPTDVPPDGGHTPNC